MAANRWASGVCAAAKIAARDVKRLLVFRRRCWTAAAFGRKLVATLRDMRGRVELLELRENALRLRPLPPRIGVRRVRRRDSDASKLIAALRPLPAASACG